MIAPKHNSRDRVLKTLDRVLSRAGIGSRTDARRWIGAGRVAVNGKTIQSPDLWVDVKRDRVTLDGRPLAAPEKRYLLLYKPKGYLTTYKDPEGRKTVYDLLPDSEWIFPVGRLDQDTTGLLIMTNDTDFADYIMSPASKVPKTYLVKSSVLLGEEQLDRLRNGVELADDLLRFVQLVSDFRKQNRPSPVQHAPRHRERYSSLLHNLSTISAQG